MRNVFILLLLASLVFGIVAAADENPTLPITVKSSDKSSGVITIQIAQGAKSAELNCNEGMSGCTDLKKGNYKMLVLPKNRGMYDCQNVRIFAESGDPDNDQKLGEYCLISK